MDNKRTIVVIGAGPAGLTAAYEILTKSKDYKVIIIEKENTVGGISKTINCNGNRIDIGGHRFFSKIERVNNWWENFMPMQGSLPKDDKILNRVSRTIDGGPDPDKTDIVMLKRNRVSRIYFNNKFYDYPISIKFETFRNMGLLATLEVGFSYIKSIIFKRKENSLEDFYINRFGKKLYSMFFESYTENVWGIHPKYISPAWGVQRVKGVSIRAVIKDALKRAVHIENKDKETSLIEEFSYPKLGPGQLWGIVADKIIELGGEIRLNSEVVGIYNKNDSINKVKIKNKDGEYNIQCDIMVSSMPLKDLAQCMENIPQEYLKIAEGLKYRDFITVGILIDKLKIANKTKIKTIGNIVPDNWIYIHNKGVKVGRIQIFNNWSPYMVKDLENTVWLGLEYFCNEGDSLWSLSDGELISLAKDELLKLGIIDGQSKVLYTHIERVKKAYPAYFGTYNSIDKLIGYLNSISNLYCIGRNGQHRYNNMDHSMCTAFEAVNNILTGNKSKDNVWNVNTEREYHEKM